MRSDILKLPVFKARRLEGFLYKRFIINHVRDTWLSVALDCVEHIPTKSRVSVHVYVYVSVLS
jgi:hypothetical protein